MKSKCYECGYKGSNPGSGHIRCRFDWKNSGVTMPNGNPHGIKNGWYVFPLNYDPVWMIDTCDAFSKDADVKKTRTSIDPLEEVLSIFASVGRF